MNSYIGQRKKQSITKRPKYFLLNRYPGMLRPPFFLYAFSIAFVLIPVNLLSARFNLEDVFCCLHPENHNQYTTMLHLRVFLLCLKPLVWQGRIPIFFLTPLLSIQPHQFLLHHVSLISANKITILITHYIASYFSAKYSLFLLTLSVNYSLFFFACLFKIFILSYFKFYCYC